ncbi:MAG TPA: phage tail tip lysozyme [Candidatus Saccharimonadales bacterium]|jgi:hypothetical protein
MIYRGFLKLLVIYSVFIFSSPIQIIAISETDRNAVLHNTPFYDAASQGGICGGGSYSVPGSNNLETVWNYFLSKNFTPEQTAGILGNLRKETVGTLDPRIKQGGQMMTDPNDPDVSAGKGRGLAQWTYDQRWQVLLDFAENSVPPRDPLSLDLQLDFIMFEMTGQPPVEGVPGGRWPRAYEEFQAMTQTGEEAVAEASYIFQRYYEVNHEVVAFNAGRIGYDEAFSERIGISLDTYADMAGASAPEITCGPDGINVEIIEGDTTDTPCQGNILNEDTVVGYREGDAYNIRICQIALPGGGTGPWVNSQISGAYSAMAVSAGSAGISVAGGGFRTNQSQIDARIRNGCPDIDISPASSCRIPTARPGYSNHQMGFAVDMSAIPVSCPTTTVVGGRNFCQNPSNATWQWLTSYAGAYGLQQLRTETWHWSIDGR